MSTIQRYSFSTLQEGRSQGFTVVKEIEIDGTDSGYSYDSATKLHSYQANIGRKDEGNHNIRIRAVNGFGAGAESAQQSILVKKGEFGTVSFVPHANSFTLFWEWKGVNPDFFAVQVKNKELVDKGWPFNELSILPPIVIIQVVHGDHVALAKFVFLDKDLRSKRYHFGAGHVYEVILRACSPGCVDKTLVIAPGVPSAPKIAVTGKHDGFRVRWEQAPENGAPITGYEAHWTNTASGATGSASFGPETALDSRFISELDIYRTWQGIGEEHGIVLGESYRVQVRGKNRNGSGVWSAGSTITAGPNPQLDGAVRSGIDRIVAGTRSLEFFFMAPGVQTPLGPIGGGFQIRWWEKVDSGECRDLAPAENSRNFLNPGGAEGLASHRANSFALESLPVLAQTYCFQVRQHHVDHIPSVWLLPAAGKPLGNENADLQALELSTGTSPGFAADRLAYRVDVSTSTMSIKVRPTLSDPLARVTVQGVSVINGRESGEIALGGKGSETVISVVVTAENGSPTKTYTVTVARSAASDNANLASLAISSNNDMLSFAAAVTTYTVTVAATVRNITVTPTVLDASAIVAVSGRAVMSGTASVRQALAPGAVTRISVMVTAEDRNIGKTYTLLITRQGATTKSSNAFLTSVAFKGADGAALTLAPAALSTTLLRYAVAVPSTSPHFTVTASPVRAASRMQYDNEAADQTSVLGFLQEGALPDLAEVGPFRAPRSGSGVFVIDEGEFTITVTAEDGVTQKIYTFPIKRGTGAPSAPRITSVTDRVKAATLVWAPPAAANFGSDISGYRYRWSNDADAEWESEGGAAGVEIPDSASLTTATVRGLAANTPYTMQIAAVNASGTGAWSASSPQARPLALAQNAPTAATLSASQAELRAEWETPLNGIPSEYRIRWALGLGSTRWINTGGGSGVSAGSAFRYTIPLLNNGQIYEVQVGARSGAGSPVWGDIVSGIPNPPHDITVLNFCAARDVLSGNRICNERLEQIVPAFDFRKQDGYTMKVPFEATAIRIQARVQKGESFQFRSGSGSFIGATPGDYGSAVMLAAAPGTPTTVNIRSVIGATAYPAYSFAITREANAGLSALTIAPGELSPSFRSDETAYTVSLGPLQSEIKIRASADAGVTIDLDGERIASGVESHAIRLSTGVPRTIRLVVTADDVTRTYTLTVTRQAVPTLRFTAAQADVQFQSGARIEALTLPSIDAGSGAAPFAYSLTAATTQGGGALPAGMQFNNQPALRTLSGTPQAVAVATTFTLRYSVSDSSTPLRTGSQLFRVTLAPPLAFASPAPQSVTFTYNAAASATLPAAGGGFAPYVYSLSGGLPAGLRFTAATRTIEGTPTAAGAYPITYQVRDALGTELSAAVRLVVPVIRPSAPGGLAATASDGALQLRWSALSGTATGGAALSDYLVRWKVGSAAWINPNGVSAGSADTIHTIDGLTNGQLYRVQVAAVNSAGAGGWSAEAQGTPQPVLSFLTLQADVTWFANLAFSLSLPRAKNGITPYGYSLVASLPSGLAFNASPPTISGTTSATGTTSITYSVTDNNNDIVTQIFSLNIRTAFSLDVDNSGSADARDGILIARFLLGVRGAGLVAPQDATAASGVETRIQAGVDTKLLDVTGDGAVNSDDGIIIARYMLGLDGDALIKELSPLPAGVTVETVKNNLAQFVQ
ncbi:MAG: cadherin-like beta sandwich domain-containing protein [Gammaproteobacteria bacterium]